MHSTRFENHDLHAAQRDRLVKFEDALETWHTVPSKWADAKMSRKGLCIPTKLSSFGLDGVIAMASSWTNLLTALDLQNKVFMPADIEGQTNICCLLRA